jgi:hypothetical protein
MPVSVCVCVCYVAKAALAHAVKVYFESECVAPCILNPLHVNGKTPSRSAMFLKFSALIITHLFFTIFVQKACTGIKDCMKFNSS